MQNSAVVHEQNAALPVFVPLLLNIPDSATALSISVRHLHYLIAKGDIATVKIGRSTRITMTELIRFTEHLESDGAKGRVQMA